MAVHMKGKSLASLDHLTREEIERIKEFHCGVTLTHPCCEEVPRLIADLEQARALLRRIESSHWKPELSPALDDNIDAYLAAAGELE